MACILERNTEMDLSRSRENYLETIGEIRFATVSKLLSLDPIFTRAARPVDFSPGSEFQARCAALPWALCRASRAACLLAAAMGHPDRLLCVFRFELTWPRPLQPGVGHFKIVSCIARTVGNPETRGVVIERCHFPLDNFFLNMFRSSYTRINC